MQLCKTAEKARAYLFKREVLLKKNLTFIFHRRTKCKTHRSSQLRNELKIWAVRSTVSAYGFAQITGNFSFSQHCTNYAEFL